MAADVQAAVKHGPANGHDVLSTLTLTITTIDSTTKSEQRHHVRFSIVGNDRPGIVQEISATIAACGANLEELSTSLESAPWSGDPLFKTQGLAALPANVEIDELTERLESLADDLIVEIEESALCS